MPYPLKGSVTVERDLAIGNRLDAGTIGVPAWATGKVYAVGDLVRNAGVLYVASTAHTAGATFVGDAASWGPVSSSSSDAIQSLSATGSVTAWASLVLVTSAAAATVTLPSATAGNIGKRVTVKSLGAGAVTVAPAGADAMQGAATLAQFEAATYEVTAAATVVRVDNAVSAVTATPLAYFSTGYVSTTWGTTTSLPISGVPVVTNPATANTTAPVPFNNAVFTVSKNVGGFTPTATGVTVPATGTYSVTYRSDQNTTLSGSGAQLVVGGAVVNFGKFNENPNANDTDGQLTLAWVGDITAGQAVQVAHVREGTGGADNLLTSRLSIEQLPTSSVVDPGLVPVVNPTTYVPAITATTTNPTKGTVTQDRATYSIVGKTMTLNYTLNQGAVGTAGSGIYRISLAPTGAQIDTSKLYVTTDPSTLGGTVLGAGPYTGNGSFLWAYAMALDANNLVVRLFDGAGYLAWGSAAGGLNSTGLSLSFTAEIPIV